MIDNTRKRKNTAFTLVELLLVITIIGILAGAVVVRFKGVAGKAKENRAKTDISTLTLAINRYEIDTGSYPASEDGLNALIEDPGASGWNGPYLTKKTFKDPWNNDYVYKMPGDHNPDYDLYSMGADQQEGTDDDVGNWEAEESF